jgi:3'-5' exoribonuclease
MNHVERLRDMARHIGCLPIAGTVLDNERFILWPASSKPGKHHHRDGGLAEHTLDVCQRASKHAGETDSNLLFLACLFHDVGKIWDYEKKDGVWGPSSHRDTVGHVSRSAMVWERVAIGTTLSGVEVQSVTHAILAHHGYREWGSPVIPQTKMAWILHLCDMMSARLDECKE